jgi:hypothetical protein
MDVGEEGEKSGEDELRAGMTRFFMVEARAGGGGIFF